MRLELPRRPLRPAAFLVLFILLTAFLPAGAEPVPAPEPSHTTLVIFADHPLPDGEWPSLYAALRLILADGSAETRVLDPKPELLRGDRFVPGTEVKSPITIFLHGDCRLSPEPLPVRYGVALGWVREDHGVIGPFVNVDCTRIGRVLGHRAAEMAKEQRVPAMAEAMARVIVHEWIHFATQNPGHASRGVAKASFSAGDLLKGLNAGLLAQKLKPPQPPGGQTAMSADTQMPQMYDGTVPAY